MNIPDPGYADDDGSPDPVVSAALAAWAEDRSAQGPVLEALQDARLLVPVVAVLGDVEVDENGLRREKTSEMGVPKLQAEGRTALPAFTSTHALALWDPEARPVAVPMHEALKAAAHEQADLIILDCAGPVPFELNRPELLALAEGRTSVDPLDDPAVAETVRAVVAEEPAVLRAHLVPAAGSGAGKAGAEVDGTLALVLAPSDGTAVTADTAKEVAGSVARRLAASENLRARLIKGLDLALLPAGTTPPGEPLYVRP